ncbi:MAG: VOC family protein [Solirubrobacterales bacterium]|nr:VOC family protein [Solirubrobacterales bacterium]MBV9472511.1 VOC family protein [Solirubrobacterales bacterium]MBV9838907.1 VOC family protein [Solirubrobacterales bacterium]
MEDAQALLRLVAKGVIGAGVIETDDIRAAYEELKGKGVTFLQEPAERPYGIEAMFRDDSGNWFSLNQHQQYGSQADRRRRVTDRERVILVAWHRHSTAEVANLRSAASNCCSTAVSCRCCLEGEAASDRSDRSSDPL